ncbi:MAG: sensor domain CHASE-containing protein [Gammaproteobacteria bacterium]|jgi:sensor domain CHASE-containing protein
MFSNKCFILFLTVAFILVGVRYVDRTEYKKTVELDRMSLGKHTQATAVGLTTSVNMRLQLTLLLAAIVTTDPTFATANFDPIATGLIGDLKGIISLQLAPNGIVSYIRDIARNRAAISHKLLTDEKVKSFTMRANEERLHIITGPLTLRQGGTSIIARLPIFTEPQGKESFLGFATVLIDVDVLLSGAGVLAEDESIDVALRGKDSAEKRTNRQSL